MPCFMDQKEDVIDLQLTPYGKRLLGQGKFKPVYYSFHDDDVLYDSARAGFYETQNETEERIQEGTPRFKTQYIFYDCESQINVNPSVNQGVADDISHQYEIGSYDFNSQYKPAWNLKFLHGEVSSSVSHVTGAQPTLLIPQLSSSIVYRTYISDKTTKPSREDPQLSMRVYDDGTYISVVPEYILLDVSEENTQYETENFDIEVFMIESVNLTGTLDTPGLSSELRSSKEVLIPLVFKKTQGNNIKNDLLVVEKDVEIDLTPRYVEYYFDIITDYEIDKEILCDGIQELKSKGIRIDTDLVECAEKKTLVRMNPYFASTNDDDLENCSTTE